MRRSLLAVAACVAVLAGASPAGAHRQVVADPDDTGGRLDIRRAVVSHQGTGGNMDVIFRLGTFEKWAKRRIRVNNGGISFQIRRSPESSWSLEIHKRGDRLKATLVMCIEGQGCQLGNDSPYRVTRPNKKSLRVEVPKRDLGGVGQTMRWRAIAALVGRNCNGLCHVDTAPDNGLARHEF